MDRIVTDLHRHHTVSKRRGLDPQIPLTARHTKDPIALPAFGCNAEHA